MKTYDKPEALLQVLHQIHHLRLDRYVQRRDRLIGDDQPRPHRQRPRDRDPLPLAAGEFEWIPAKMDGVETDQTQQFDDAVTARGVRKCRFVHIQRFGDDVLDADARAERRVGVLEYDLQRAPALAQGGAAQFGQVCAIETNFARGRFGQAQDHPAGGRFAATGLADQRQGFAGTDIEGDAIDGFDMPPATGKCFDSERTDNNGSVMTVPNTRRARFPLSWSSAVPAHGTHPAPGRSGD